MTPALPHWPGYWSFNAGIYSQPLFRPSLGFRAPHWGGARMVALAGIGSGDRPVLVDALAVIGAALGTGVVQLPVAGVGNDSRLRGVGGHADPRLLVGSAIVVASGRYILWGETLRRRSPGFEKRFAERGESAAKRRNRTGVSKRSYCRSTRERMPLVARSAP